MKTDVSNVILICKLKKQQQIFESFETFGDPNKYRHSPNHVKCFSDWVYDLYAECLRTASKLFTHFGDIDGCYEDGKENESLADSKQS